MRRSWIKVETNTPDKPEICVIASQLRLDSDAVMGKLIRLWAWAELNVSERNETAVTFEFLDKLTGKKGFSAALEKAGWLQRRGELLIFPNFSRHNGRAAKGRAQTAQRVSRHRKLKAQKDSSVTPSSLPKEVDVVDLEQDMRSEEIVISDVNTHIENRLDDVKFDEPVEVLVTNENHQAAATQELSEALPAESEVSLEVTIDGFQPESNLEALPSAKRKAPRVNLSDDFDEQPLLF